MTNTRKTARRLTEQEKERLSMRLAAGEPVARLAREFNVTKPTVYRWQRKLSQTLAETKSLAADQVLRVSPEATNNERLRWENEMLKRAIADLYIQKESLKDEVEALKARMA